MKTSTPGPAYTAATDAHAIAEEFLKDKISPRTKQPFMDHINEGLLILRKIGVPQFVEAAWCIHPLLQKDEWIRSGCFLVKDLPPDVICLTMEFRMVANQIRPDDCRASRALPFGAWPKAIKMMLIADKIQEWHSYTVYKRHFTEAEINDVTLYFDEWLSKILKLTPDQIVEYTKIIADHQAENF